MSAQGPYQTVRYGRNDMVQHETATAEEVFAGALVELDTNGELVNHATAGEGPDVLRVAIESRGRGMELGDSYPVDDNAKYVAASGGGVYLRLAGGSNLATAANATVDPTTPLVSNGDGTVRALDTSKTGETREAVIGNPTEAVDNSGSADVAFVPVDLSP